MNKLRTLKEVKHTYEGKYTMATRFMSIDEFREELRQEAIKWIKECHATIKQAVRNNTINCAIMFNGQDRFVGEWYAIIDEKVIYFNLTEKDLEAQNRD